jgi:hypothetical protein
MITSALVKGTFGAPGYLFLWETLVATVPSVKSPHLPGPAPTAGRLAERLGRFQVDHQFELRGLLHGRSAGLAPLGILSMYLAARRNKSG